MDRYESSVRRKKIREKAVIYKGGKCKICGYNRCLASMDFHHLDPMTKNFSIAARMSSFKAIQKELDLCVLLCSNCHREVHDGLHSGYLVYEDSDRGPDEE
jgi:predicted HNH restriction endonuclease